VSPLAAYHSTSRRHRESIQEHGLLPNLPNATQLYGVYVFRDDLYHRTRHMRIRGAFRQVRVRWAHETHNDLWEVAYVGPLCPDQFVENGLVLYYPPQLVSLLTQLSR
jgi:hypothetical protein